MQSMANQVIVDALEQYFLLSFITFAAILEFDEKDETYARNFFQACEIVFPK